MDIRITGLNHRVAPVELREKLAVEGKDLAGALSALRGTAGAEEAVILSTCNRVEYYTASQKDAPGPEAVTGHLASLLDVAEEKIAPSLYHHRGAEAVRHLFRVTSSLDSMVLGETQIIGQVKDAYFAAKEAGATGRILNRLFQRALAAAKRVHAATSLGEGNVSIPSVAANLAEKIFQDLSTKSLVIVGAGEMGELTMGAFRTRGVTRMHVVNRTVENARTLASQCRAEAHPLEALPLVLPHGDIVITCIRSEGHVLGPEQLAAALDVRLQEPMFLIDIAVPRNVDPESNRLENLYLYNVDDLQEIVRQNVLDREQEIARCEPLIDEETHGFLRDVVPPDISALMTDLRGRMTAVGTEELERTLGRLNGVSEDDRQKISELVHRLTNKWLHPLSETLRGDLSPRDLDIIRKLFGIK